VPDQPLRIALLGGIPASLGGGGLEVQRDRTAAALSRRGHEVFHVAHEPDARPFDLLHVFGSELDVCHQLSHWRRNPAPLVVSPVVVVAPGAEERMLRWAARVPLASVGPRFRAATLQRAGLLVALTQHEAALLRSLAPGVPVRVLGNGVEPLEPVAPDLDALGLRPPYGLLLGTVSARKRQAEAVRLLGRTRLQPVVIGGFDGDDAGRRAFESAVQDSGGRWLGELRDPAAVRGLLAAADALVHLSAAEGQSLAVLEAISVGTRVACSPLPANRELAARHPDLVVLCPDDAALERAVVSPPPTTRAPVPTWDDVARELEAGYLALVSSG
jgi:glycosyltransferase involved in cell wall biosynthesis